MCVHLYIYVERHAYLRIEDFLICTTKLVFSFGIGIQSDFCVEHHPVEADLNKDV